MRTQSNVAPTQAFEIEQLNEVQCNILFYENVKEIEKDEQLNYEYDFYRLPVIYRETLTESIESNYEEWLNAAKRHEDEKAPLSIEEEVVELQASQSNQDDKILTSFIANTELFELLLTTMLVAIDIEEESTGGIKMVEVYVTLILEGHKTLEQVPAIIRPKVEQQLKLLGVL